MTSAPPLKHHPQVVRGFLASARVAGLLMIAVGLAGLAALAGWGWQLPPLTSVLPGHQSVKVSSSIGFVLSGLALLASLRRGRLPRRLSQGLSLAVLALGAVNLTESVWQLDLGLDHLFEDPFALAPGKPPGRLSPASAAAFVLLGAMGFLVSSKRWLWLREMLALALLAIGMLGLAYGFALAGEISTAINPLAIQTAVLLLVGPLGWMSSRPTSGLTSVATADSLGGAFARRLLLPSLLLPVACIIGFKALQSTLGASEVFALALAAMFTGGSLAWMIWWVAKLLDRVERQGHETEALRGDASTDPLTGLANRRAFDAALANLAHSRREDEAVFSLLMLDLDQFKAYNDDFGHLAGDEVLRITSRLLRAARWRSDLPARYGGEEFALLLPRTDAEHARRVADRILNDFRELPWPLGPVTVSIGIAEARPDEGVEALVQRADDALYAAKHAGRNRAVLAR